MAKANYDNTVHNDEFHYNVTIAAAYADRASNESTEKRLRTEHRRLVERLDDGSIVGGDERRAANVELERLGREIRETVDRRRDIEERIKEVVK